MGLDRGGKAAAVLGAVVLALSYGLNYGISNHNTYLLGALRLVHPELLTRDWLATQTTDYHRHFAYLAAGLLRLSENGWPFALANLAMVALGGWLLYLLLKADPGTPRPGLAFLIVTAFAMLTGTYSVGESYLFSGILQPSTFGATGLLLAVYLFVRGRFLLSGAALGAAGFFHTNYLVLGLPLFLLAHLLLGTRQLLPRAVRQLTPVLVLALPSVPLLMTAASGEGGAGALRILFEVRSPHHYDPGFFKTEFLALAGWLALLAACLPADELKGEGPPPARRRGRLVLALLALMATTGLLSVAWRLQLVTQLYPWRLAPLLVLFSQIYVGRAFLRLLARQPYDGLLRSRYSRAALLTLGAGLLLFYHYRYSREDYLLALGTLLLLGTLALAAARRYKSWPGPLPAPAAGVLVLGLFCLAAIPALTDVERNSNLLSSRPAAEASLYRWARGTEQGAVFLIPPQLDDFRLQARRAVVVDWKSTPLLPDELAEWYARLTAVSGGRAPESPEQAARGYAGLTQAAFRDLADRFAVTYVVVEAETENDLPPDWPVVFSNERFEVRACSPDLPA